MRRNKLASLWPVFLFLVVILATACTAAQPEVVETVEVERVVRETVVVESTIEVERVVTPTAVPPPQGGTFNMAIQTDIPFNPLYSRGTDAVYALRAIFSQLARSDENALPQPDLATSWEHNEDGTEWTFFLNPDAVWHDGEPVTAEDVKFTFDSILDPDVGSFKRRDLAGLNEVQVVDDHTVKFFLEEGNAWWPQQVAFGFFIIPKHILEGQQLDQATEFNTTNPIGSGPFKVTEVVLGSHVVAEANEDFYRGRPNIDSIVFKVLPDINTQVAQLQAGELDYVTVKAQHLETLSGQPGIEVKILPQATTLMLNYIHDSPYLQDLEVREALIYGLNRPQIIQSVSLNTGIIGEGPLSPAVKAYHHPDLPIRFYDPDIAQDLLAEAGWEDTDGDGTLDKDIDGDGVRDPFVLNLISDKGDPAREQITVIAQQAWERLGIEVEAEILERSVWAGRLRARPGAKEGQTSCECDVYVSNRSYQENPDRMRFFWYTDSSTNIGNYSNPEVDALLDAGKQAFDLEERAEIYKEFQEVFAADAPWVLVYYDPEKIAKDINLNMPDMYIREALAWVDSWYFEE
jgi:peptide/nickel transport system substrate-binding protein